MSLRNPLLCIEINLFSHWSWVYRSFLTSHTLDCYPKVFLDVHNIENGRIWRSMQFTFVEERQLRRFSSPLCRVHGVPPTTTTGLKKKTSECLKHGIRLLHKFQSHWNLLSGVTNIHIYCRSKSLDFLRISVDLFVRYSVGTEAI